MMISEPEKPSLDLLNRRITHLEIMMIEMKKLQEEILANQKEILRVLPKPAPVPPNCEYL